MSRNQMKIYSNRNNLRHEIGGYNIFNTCLGHEWDNFSRYSKPLISSLISRRQDQEDNEKFSRTIDKIITIIWEQDNRNRTS